MGWRIQIRIFCFLLLSPDQFLPPQGTCMVGTPFPCSGILSFACSIDVFFFTQRINCTQYAVPLVTTTSTTTTTRAPSTTSMTTTTTTTSTTTASTTSSSSTSTTTSTAATTSAPPIFRVQWTNLASLLNLQSTLRTILGLNSNSTSLPNAFGIFLAGANPSNTNSIVTLTNIAGSINQINLTVVGR